MIYNNLIYLLVVILILSANGIPDAPQIPPSFALLTFLLKGLLYQQVIHRVYACDRIQSAAQYFSAAQKTSIIAIVAFSIDVYLLDCQYYITRLPLAAMLPAFVNFVGVSLFFGYLAIIWIAARKSYHAVFGRDYSRRSFLFSNIKINLPIILPWLFLSLLVNLLALYPAPRFKEFLALPWGEPLIFLVFILILAVSFPAIITRLWNCTPLPAGDVRNRIEAFCQKQQLGYAEILTWPLFEGKILTAGVMGLVKKFRYLLVTPAMLNAMTPKEIEAVMAHEIGHVKKHHLQLYFFLFIGFGLLAQLSAYPVLYLVLNSDLFYRMSLLANKEPGAALAFLSTIAMFVLMIIYFRYVFGFFIRNFERQADLHVFDAMADSGSLIRVLEKIAWLSGNIRDLPDWHHFSIGQRVDFLEKCQQDRSIIKKHNRKVHTALFLYVLTIVIAGVLLWSIPKDLLDGAPREKFVEAVIKQKIEADPENALWHQLLGDLQQERKRYLPALESYEKVLELAPDNPDALNNLAWLLLTVEEKGILDPGRALALAREAARLKPHAYILDTLATAYWMNGFNRLAVITERKAIAKNPANGDYYRKQMEKFSTPKQRPATE